MALTPPGEYFCHIDPSISCLEGTMCVDDNNKGSAANNTTCKRHETTTTTQQPMHVNTLMTTRYHIPRIIIQVISRRRDIKVWIGVCRGYCVHGTRPICLHRPTNTTVTCATRSLVFRLQQHQVHADLSIFLHRVCHNCITVTTIITIKKTSKTTSTDAATAANIVNKKYCLLRTSAIQPTHSQHIPNNFRLSI